MLGRSILTLACVTLLLMPLAASQVPTEHVHLGLSTSDASTTVSVVFTAVSSTPPVIVVTGPGGDMEFPSEAVPGPSARPVYEAHLTGLVPGAAYTYTVAGFEGSFEMPPATLSDERPLRLVALGDMGIRDSSQAAVDTIASLAPDLVLHAGDISYAEGNQVDWDTWFDMVQPVAASTPWLPAIGNHEVGPFGIGNMPVSAEARYFEQVFALPGTELWYSFDVAGVHVVALDTFSTLDAPTQEQIAWLAEDLAASADAPWTIAFLHEPLWSSNSHGSAPDIQDAFADLFDEHGVDLVLAAHDHGYERTYPMRAGEPVRASGATSLEGEGVIYVVTGGGGNSLYSGWEEPAPRWSAARGSLYHVTELVLTPNAIEGRVVATTGDTFSDSFSIVKPAPVVGETGDEAAPTPMLGALVLLVVLGAVAAMRRR